MTVTTLGMLLISFSAAWVHYVSAGGAYCAKSARARAAALGLDYPGVRGAPNLSGPPPYSAQNPHAPHHRRSQNNPQPPAMNYNTFYQPPKEFPHFHPAGYGSHTRVQSNLLSSLSRGEPLNSRWSNFEQVKRVGPLTEKQPPGQDDLVQRASESHKIPFPFVYNRPSVSGDAPVPNRHGVRGASRLPVPNIPGFGVYYVVYPMGGSKPWVVYPVTTEGSLPAPAEWKGMED
ncbi:uncharacterized protein [Eucyclogobius newberryi]|uniref:uncharacterized protein n=1 Tax=Eucyclogobius newberryi TaxID=166745 RepID=UPI003B5CC6CB